jgi:predicted acylesterase/phospholipase RssA
MFESEPIHAYLESLFERQGRTNDFRELTKRLVVIAADLDSGEAARFGEPGWDDVPISKAVQASTALPGVYSPVVIDGRYYVDGVLIKTLHASVALEAGADLVFCINPLVPVDTGRAVEAGIMRRGKLVDRGLPAVLEQSLRTMIRSRLQVGLATYKERYKGSDVILLEPRRDDYRMFFTNIFSFSQRRAVCEHAYRRTRRNLRARRKEIEPILESHGLSLRHDVLEDPTRQVWSLLENYPSKSQTTSASAPTALATVERLDRVLTRLERLVDERAGRAPSPQEEDDPVREALEEKEKPRLRLVKAG